MEEDKVKGFAEVLVAQDVSEGIGALIQTSGLGGLTHNTGTCLLRLCVFGNVRVRARTCSLALEITRERARWPGMRVRVC